MTTIQIDPGGYNLDSEAGSGFAVADEIFQMAELTIHSKKCKQNKTH